MTIKYFTKICIFSCIQKSVLSQNCPSHLADDEFKICVSDELNAIRSYNNILTAQLGDAKADISSFKTENDQLKTDIQNLTEKNADTDVTIQNLQSAVVNNQGSIVLLEASLETANDQIGNHSLQLQQQIGLLQNHSQSINDLEKHSSQLEQKLSSAEISIEQNFLQIQKNQNVTQDLGEEIEDIKIHQLVMENDLEDQKYNFRNFQNDVSQWQLSTEERLINIETEIKDKS